MDRVEARPADGAASAERPAEQAPGQAERPSAETRDLARALLSTRAELERLSLLADNVPALIAYYERGTNACAYANRPYAQTFGQTVKSIIGRTFAEVIGEEAARLIQPQVDVVLTQARTVSYVRQVVRPDAATLWMEVSLVPHRLGDGPVVGVFVLISDITRHREAEIAVRESEERLSKFMDASVEGIAFHKNGFITDVNAPIAALVGLSPDQMRGRFVLDFVAPEHLARVQRGMLEGGEVPYEAAILNREGQSIAVEFIVRTTHRAGEELRMVVVRDVRDRLAARERIRFLAQHDALTGLHNRGAFLELLEDRLSEHRAAGKALALMFVDLDHFKRVNDTLGHLAGDALLRDVAQRVRGLLPLQALAGRFGGDEFVILMPEVADRQAVFNLAERVRAAVAEPLHVDGHEVKVTATIGLSVFPDDGQVSDELLRHADVALYVSKDQGRDGVGFYAGPERRTGAPKPPESDRSD